MTDLTRGQKILAAVYYVPMKIRDWWFWFSLSAYGHAANKVDKERSETFKKEGEK